MNQLVKDFYDYVKAYKQNPYLYTLANKEGCELLSNFLKKHLDPQVVKSNSFEKCMELLGLSQIWNGELNERK